MTDLERYGRHEEGCDSEFCSVTMCGRIKGSPVHFVDVREQHLFRPQPCSCGFASALLAQGWQDIATAPKDGTAILAWDGRVMTTIDWMKGLGWRLIDPGAYSEDSSFDATHWHLLPEAPAPPGVRHATE